MDHNMKIHLLLVEKLLDEMAQLPINVATNYQKEMNERIAAAIGTISQINPRRREKLNEKDEGYIQYIEKWLDDMRSLQCCVNNKHLFDQKIADAKRWICVLI